MSLILDNVDFVFILFPCWNYCCEFFISVKFPSLSLNTHHQRVNVRAYIATAHDGFPQKRLEEDLRWIVPGVPRWPSRSGDWTSRPRSTAWRCRTTERRWRHRRTVFCVLREFSMQFSSDTRHCQTVKSKSVCSHSTCKCLFRIFVVRLKSYLLKTQSLKVFPLKPGAGHYIAIYATLTAKDFFPS